MGKTFKDNKNGIKPPKEGKGIPPKGKKPMLTIAIGLAKPTKGK